MYQYVLFDADDTLFDFQKAEAVSFRLVFEQFQLPYTEAAYATYREVNRALWNRHDAGEITKEELQSQRFSLLFEKLGLEGCGRDAERAYRAHLNKQYWLLPYAKELCEELSQRVSLSIVTNGFVETQRSRVIHSGIANYISHLVISDEVGYQKPDPRFFEAAFRIIGCKPGDRILMVGDSLSSDIQGAKNVGLDCCWYNPQGIRQNRFFDIEYEVRDLREIPAIVLSGRAKRHSASSNSSSDSRS